jgi:Flp pilus assembly protein protease CpaA
LFLTTLNIAAWQDLKTGTVSTFLLVSSLAATCVLGGVSYYADGFEPVRLHISAAVIVFILLLFVVSINKLGGADLLIFSQLTLMFGLIGCVETLVAASAMGLMFAFLKWLREPDRPKLADFRKQEVRFVPFIALAFEGMLAAEKFSAIM